MDIYEPQWLALDGAVNVRDLGGMPTRDGRAIRRHRLIRADNLEELSGDDVTRLMGLGLRHVVDLRSEAELATVATGPLHARPEVTHHHHSFLVDWEHQATAEEALAAVDDATPVTDAGELDPLAKARAANYWEYLRNRPDSVLAALGVIAADDGAVIVHCAAGKDRTGTLVALALSAAEVDDALIAADYARSAERIDAILHRLRGNGFYDIAGDPDTVRDQTPTAESMLHFLGALRRHGGAQGWLHDHGWSAGEIEQLRRSLVG